MKQLDSFIKEVLVTLRLPLDKKPLLCIKERLLLLYRFKLKQLINSEKAKKRVVHLNEFINKSPECDVDPEHLFQEIFREMAEKIKLKIN